MRFRVQFQKLLVVNLCSVKGVLATIVHLLLSFSANKSCKLTHLSRTSSLLTSYGIVLFLKEFHASVPVDQFHEALAYLKQLSFRYFVQILISFLVFRALFREKGKKVRGCTFHTSERNICLSFKGSCTHCVV